MTNPGRFARMIVRGGALGAVVLIAGCSDAPGGEGATLNEPPAPVASVSSAGVTVEFYSVPDPNGEALIGMFERGSAFAKASPVAPLIGQSLTSQEIYLALAGPGAVAPKELVDAQAVEAARLGRSANVRIVSIDRSVPLVDKDYVACANILYSANLSSWAGGDSGWSSGPSNGYYSNSCAVGLYIDSTFAVGIGGCNESSNTEMFYQLIQGDWPGTPTLQGFGTYLGPYQYGVWYWRYSYTTGGRLYGASYSYGGLLGNQTTCGPIDLVSGYWKPVAH
jgi:hypothetical protein